MARYPQDLVVILIGASTWLAPLGASAQGATTDIILGRVMSADGHPVVGATVLALSIETRLGRTATTNTDGRYIIVFPDGGGRYEVVARRIGYPPSRVLVARQPYQDRLVADLVMGPTRFSIGTGVNMLPPVHVTAKRPDPGSSGRELTADELERLPSDAVDPNAIATLAPGVVGIGATDTLSASFSVAGQRSSLNAVTLDGSTFSGAVPQEALRSANVITSTYDVSHGQFTGGFVELASRGGTNTPNYSFGYINRNAALAFGGQGPTAFSSLRDQNTLSAGAGGPIIKDHVFTFGAFNLNRRSDDLVDLVNADPATLAQIGVTPGQVSAFLAALEAKHIPLTSPLVSDSRWVDNLVVFQRLDFLIGANSLVLRGDYLGRLQDGSHVSPYTLPTTGGRQNTGAGGLYLSLTTHLPGNFINELRTYGRRFYQTSSPDLTDVAGDVDLAPTTALSFGGNPSLPQSMYTDLWEASDEISWVSPRGGHHVRLGTLVDLKQSSSLFTTGANGIYTYNSLSAFEHDSVTSFTRTFNASPERAGSVSGAVYAGDAWVPLPPLQLTYGVRVEGTEFTGAPAANPEVEALFGHRTDLWPSEIHINPRVGFSYTAGGVATVNGGFGEFRANAPEALFSSAQSENGLSNGESQLLCIGSGIVFQTTPIPSSCVGGSTKQVTVFDKDFESPRAWRGSLGVTKPLPGGLSASVDASYARGVALFGVTDANLRTTPAFYLNDEGRRPVYSALIDPATGAVSYDGSRKDAQFGNVWDVGSRLQSDTRQITVALNGSTRRGLSYRLSYTYQHVRDQSSFSDGSAASGFASPTAGGNPNVVGWAPSDLGRTHQFLGSIIWPIVPSVEVTSVARVTSGVPYTPIVNQDINGDGATNDRAFVFNPATLAGTADSALAAPMRQLLSSGSSRIRDCLERQLGQIAGRNSCDGPWSPTVDLRLNYRPSYLGLQRRLTLTLQAVNTLTGIDLLVHGPQHLAGWGQPFPPDNVLLFVHGFDPVHTRFIYAVNPHFGQPYTAYGAYGAPFQLAFQVRYTFGERPSIPFGP